PPASPVAALPDPAPHNGAGDHPVVDCCSDAHASLGLYGQAEFLLWWLKQTPLPPLVTQGPLSDGVRAGALGMPYTQVLFGSDHGEDPRVFMGGRFTAG